MIYNFRIPILKMFNLKLELKTRYCNKMTILSLQMWGMYVHYETLLMIPLLKSYNFTLKEGIYLQVKHTAKNHVKKIDETKNKRLLISNYLIWIRTSFNINLFIDDVSVSILSNKFLCQTANSPILSLSRCCFIFVTNIFLR